MVKLLYMTKQGCVQAPIGRLQNVFARFTRRARGKVLCVVMMFILDVIDCDANDYVSSG